MQSLDLQFTHIRANHFHYLILPLAGDLYCLAEQA
jgi:hypothetical protein